jgi:hypothetical protein
MTDPRQLRGLELIPDDQWRFYEEVLLAAAKTGAHFALGGAFAWAAHTGLFRNTKDLDLYVMPSDREKFISALTSLNAHDLYDELPYDRGWIYRATRDGFIVDVIWSMANYRRELDSDYVSGGPTLDLRGIRLKVLPAEELVLNKLYILQRGRCDWFDVFNVLYCTHGRLDWTRLLNKLDDDVPLLGAALRVFAWLAPGCAARFPDDLWNKVGLRTPAEDGPDFIRERVNLLDSRPWFLPALAPGEQIFVEIK